MCHIYVIYVIYGSYMGHIWVVYGSYRRLRAETPYLIDMVFLHWYTVRRSFSSGIGWYKPFLRIWLSNKVIHRKQNTLSQHIVKLLGFTGVKRPYVEIYNDTDCYKKLSVQYAHICYKIVVCDFSAKTLGEGAPRRTPFYKMLKNWCCIYSVMIPNVIYTQLNLLNWITVGQQKM